MLTRNNKATCQPEDYRSTRLKQVDYRNYDDCKIIFWQMFVSVLLWGAGLCFSIQNIPGSSASYAYRGPFNRTREGVFFRCYSQEMGSQSSGLANNTRNPCVNFSQWGLANSKWWPSHSSTRMGIKGNKEVNKVSGKGEGFSYWQIQWRRRDWTQGWSNASLHRNAAPQMRLGTLSFLLKNGKPSDK